MLSRKEMKKMRMKIKMNSKVKIIVTISIINYFFKRGRSSLSEEKREFDFDILI